MGAGAAEGCSVLAGGVVCAGCCACASAAVAEDSSASDARAAVARPYGPKGKAFRLIRSSQRTRTRLASTRTGLVFRTDSAGRGRSRSPERIGPAPPLTPAEIPVPEPARRAADPKLPRMHSIEHGPRRGSELEKD